MVIWPFEGPGLFADIAHDAASTTACQCPPRSATRLSLAQPEASLVMVLEFFFRQSMLCQCQWFGDRKMLVASSAKSVLRYRHRQNRYATAASTSSRPINPCISLRNCTGLWDVQKLKQLSRNDSASSTLSVRFRPLIRATLRVLCYSLLHPRATTPIAYFLVCGVRCRRGNNWRSDPNRCALLRIGAKTALRTLTCWCA